jgi:tetratricopeptide (TPR) repeat protein
LNSLREQLAEDPEADVFIVAARELVDRKEWGEAASILSRALEIHADVREGWALLVRAAVEGGNFELALQVLARIGPTPEREPTLTKLEIRARVGAGQAERAAELAQALVLLHPHLGPAEALLAEPVAPAVTHADRVRPLPDHLVTLERATAYVRAGRPDRAMRVLRRLAFHFPRDRELRARLQELALADPAERRDDLSEEMPDPAKMAPPGLIMPKPMLDPEYDTAVTQPAIDLALLRRMLEEANAVAHARDGVLDVHALDDEDTALLQRPTRAGSDP